MQCCYQHVQADLSLDFMLHLQHSIAAHLRSRSSGSPMSC